MYILHLLKEKSENNTYLVYILCDINDFLKIVSEYDQEIPQSQTAGNPVALWGRDDQPSQDTKKTN